MGSYSPQTPSLPPYRMELINSVPPLITSILPVGVHNKDLSTVSPLIKSLLLNKVEFRLNL